MERLGVLAGHFPGSGNSEGKFIRLQHALLWIRALNQGVEAENFGFASNPASIRTVWTVVKVYLS